MRNGNFFRGVLVALLVVGVLAVVGFAAYNAGMMQGAVQSGNLVVPPPADGTAPVAPVTPYYGFYHPFWFGPHWGFGFGFLWCLGPIFFFFLIFALFRLVLGPRRGWGGPGMRGGWNGQDGEIPQGVKDMHRRLHEQEQGTPPPAPGVQS